MACLGATSLAVGAFLLVEHYLWQDDLSIDLGSVDDVVVAVVQHQGVKTVVVLVARRRSVVLQALPMI